MDVELLWQKTADLRGGYSAFCAERNRMFHFYFTDETTTTSRTMSENQSKLENIFFNLPTMPHIWPWHIWSKLMNLPEASDLCNPDIWALHHGWIAACCRDVSLVRISDQRKDDSRKSVSVWSLETVRENGHWAVWLITTQAHHLSDMAVWTHIKKDAGCSPTHALNLPIRPLQHCSSRGGWGGDGGLQCYAAWLLISYLQTDMKITFPHIPCEHIHTHTTVPQLLWQCHNSCLWMENGAVCQRLSWVETDILQSPI